MKKVLILQSNMKMHPTDILTQTNFIQAFIDKGNAAIIPDWLEVVGTIKDDGDGIEVKIVSQERTIDGVPVTLTFGNAKEITR